MSFGFLRGHFLTDEELEATIPRLRKELDAAIQEVEEGKKPHGYELHDRARLLDAYLQLGNRRARESR